MKPNIVLIGGVDTEGDIYMSMLQGINDSEIFKMYLSKLAMQLDKDRPDWREKTILMLDSAPYHTSATVTSHMKNLKIKYTFTGPRCYAGSPCEKLWAHLKDRDLNPDGLFTSKK